MSDGGEKRRPNAHYRLSKENANEDEITYYYNRENRLAKAPQSVQDLYNEEPPRRSGLFRSLIDTKAKKLTFASIVVIILMFLMISVLGLTSDSEDIEGNRISAQAIRYEGTVIVTIKKTIKKNIIGRTVSAYTGAVNIAVTIPHITPQDIFYHKIFFTLEPQEMYRFTVPFDSQEMTLVIQTEKRTVTMKVKPE